MAYWRARSNPLLTRNRLKRKRFVLEEIQKTATRRATSRKIWRRLSETAGMPAVSLSLLQIFLLVALLVAVFWISSRTKRFLFNRLLAQSGLDRSLQYAVAQVVSNIVLVVGIFIVLENTGIHLAALTVFAGAVGVGLGFGLQNIASNFISGLVILAERPITIGDRVEVAGIAGQVEHIRARSTVIRTNDNIMMIVPNTKFIDSPVTN